MWKHDYNRSGNYVSILAGEYFATDRRICLSTLLGSCVAACLYDPVNRIMGINHFLLCGTRKVPKTPLMATEPARLGVHAMELLINEMLKLGARKKNMKAKAFGGATLTPFQHSPFESPGELNSIFVRDFLEKEGIPLTAEDLGGDHGRVVYFLPDDYSVMVRKIRKTLMPTVVRHEEGLPEKAEGVKKRAEESSELWK